MKANRKAHHRGVLSDSVLSAPIALLLALLLIASTALVGGSVLAQSKRKPAGGRRAQVKPSFAVVPDERDPYANPEILAQLANDKLTELTEKEAPSQPFLILQLQVVVPHENLQSFKSSQ